MSIYSDSKSNPSKKPDTIPVKPEGIPDELKQFKQWVVWRWFWNHEQQRWAKPPYSPLSHFDNCASSANERHRATWGNFEDALYAYQAGGWDGVGFVFTSSDPYCGIDLDDCRNPETGELEAWAREMLVKLDSYSEVSPTMTGAKVVAKAKMPGERHKWKVESGAVEMYDGGRYFTVTGHPLSETPANINERQAAVDALYASLCGQDGKTPEEMTTEKREEIPDDELIRRAKCAADGTLFRALWDGDSSLWGKGKEYKSHSDARAALVFKLAFWTKNRDQIDRLFRRSGMFNDKWEREREKCINDALAKVVNTYTPDDDRESFFASLQQEGANQKKAKKGKPKSAAARLIEVAASRCDFFSTPDGIPYASLVYNGRREAYRIPSTPFRRWLTAQARATGIIPGSKALQDAMLSLESIAFEARKTREVFHRLARIGDAIYLDLCNERGESVEVTAEGWRVTADCPVPFVRHGNMAALPAPVPGGSLDELRHFINVADEDFPLVRGWLLDCYKGRGPYPVLLFNGEQGSAKSTLTKLLRQQIDPVHKAPACRLQRDEEDLSISAEKSMLLSYDNVSSLPQWLSDSLASLATGSGLRRRKKYSDDEETVFGTAVPIVFNGIPDFADSPDLLDRAIKVTLPPIPDDHRKDEEELFSLFAAAKPRILGATLDAVSAGLRHFASVQLDRKPRMALSARWITACETGLPGERFLEVYERNREELNTLAIESSTVASAILAWSDEWTAASWEGTPTELHALLLERISGVTAWKDFPKAANRLSAEMRRVTPALRRAGLLVTRKDTKKGTRFTLERETPPIGSTFIVPQDQTPLSVLTGGEIPFDVPYQLRLEPGRMRRAEFRLTADQLARLSVDARSSLKQLQKDGPYLYPVKAAR